MSRFVKLTGSDGRRLSIRAEQVTAVLRMGDGAGARIDLMDGEGWPVNEPADAVVAKLDAALSVDWDGPANGEPATPAVQLTWRRWLWLASALAVGGGIGAFASYTIESMLRCLSPYALCVGYWWQFGSVIETAVAR